MGGAAPPTAPARAPSQDGPREMDVRGESTSAVVQLSNPPYPPTTGTIGVRPLVRAPPKAAASSSSLDDDETTLSGGARAPATPSRPQFSPPTRALFSPPTTLFRAALSEMRTISPPCEADHAERETTQYRKWISGDNQAVVTRMVQGDARETRMLVTESGGEGDGAAVPSSLSSTTLEPTPAAGCGSDGAIPPVVASTASVDTTGGFAPAAVVRATRTSAATPALETPWDSRSQDFSQRNPANGKPISRTSSGPIPAPFAIIHSPFRPPSTSLQPPKSHEPTGPCVHLAPTPGPPAGDHDEDHALKNGIATDPDHEGPLTKGPFVIGICGGSCSGKSTLSDVLKSHLARVAFIPADSFYRELNAAERELAREGEYDFDHPGAIAWDELIDAVRAMKRGRQLFKNDCSMWHRRPHVGTLVCVLQFLFLFVVEEEDSNY